MGGPTALRSFRGWIEFFVDGDEGLDEFVAGGLHDVETVLWMEVQRWFAADEVGEDLALHFYWHHG